MSDPFETLRHLDEGPTGPALPASEVRRRGDRMRRRRTAVRALGAACAVAVITTGGIALGHDVTDSAPPPPASQGPSPSPAPTTPNHSWTAQALSVPDDFPLDSGMPAEDGDAQRQEFHRSDRPRYFDPCHNNEGAADRGRTDLVQLQQTGPAYGYYREVAVYEDSSSANEAMLLAKGELERCSVWLYDGISRDVWEPSTRPSDRPPADDVIMAVNHGYANTGITTAATSWVVMRVGNAIVTLGNDGEFGASPSSVGSVTADELGTYILMAPSLCPFADSTTKIGCGAGSTAPGPGAVTDPGPSFLLSEGTLREVTGIDSFDTVPDAQMATLACQAQWLSALGPETADYRQFEARSKQGHLTAWAGTAVLGFSDETAARAAYGTVVGDWLAGCSEQVDPSHRRVTAAGTGLGSPTTGDTAQGPYYYRAVKLTAPERCVECDAAWDDEEGVAVVGNRLVLGHVAYGGDMQLEVRETGALDALLPELIKLAKTDDQPGASTSSDGFLGPDGYGPLELGMTAAEVEATGRATLEDGHGEGCTSFTMWSRAAKREVATGYLSPKHGLVAIFAGPDVETPQGIRVGSTFRDLTKAFAHLTGANDSGNVVAPASDTVQYVMAMDRKRVAELALAMPYQDCFG